MNRLLKYILALTGFATYAAASAQVNTEQVMRIGQNALYFEDYMLSIQYFNQAIQAKPYLAQPYLMRAIAKINLDDFAGAEADAAKAIDLNPFLTDAWEVRGVARQNLDNNDGAISDYNEALRLLPRNRQIMFNRSLALTDTKKYEQADSSFAELLKYYPGFDNGYIGRAKLRLAMADTTAASADIDKALETNRNILNAYILRADIAINSKKDYSAALADMNEAVKLEPRLAGLYINRAFLRYSLDDYFGAMADYDYAIQLEPLNPVALFNRGLLEMEVGDNDKALRDYDALLSLDPDNYRALYNRAVIYGEKHRFDEAIADVDRLIDRFPDFSGAYYLRSEFMRGKGEMAHAQADYKKAVALAKSATDSDATPESLSENEETSRRFRSLLTIENNTDMAQEYNNSAIRGKVQNRDINVEIEPMMQLSYYDSPTELRRNTYYIKEVDQLNATRMLRFLVVVTSRPPMLSDPEIIQRHFSSIDYYNSYLSTHEPRAIDYIGRAMDFVTVRNYAAAISDLDRAISLTPDFALAYYLRAQARYLASTLPDPGSSEKENAPHMPQVAPLADVLADFDRAIELSPTTAMAWFNKGNILFEMGDYTSALAAYTRAIELQPDMGEAFYNRGYIYLRLGNRPAGIADLSKSGELGIVSAYNLIKRMTN